MKIARVSYTRLADGLRVTRLVDGRSKVYANFGYAMVDAKKAAMSRRFAQVPYDVEAATAASYANMSDADFSKLIDRLNGSEVEIGL